MSVHLLSAADVQAAIRQLVENPNFRAANRHLSAMEARAILGGQWPQKPVFTPYASTHHGYSQSKLNVHAPKSSRLKLSLENS